MKASERVDVWFDNAMKYGPWLPLHLTDGSKSRAVRLFGLASFAVWFFPSMIVCLFPLLLLMVAGIIAHTWDGE